MRRRAFIVGLVGAAAWPVVSWAQQAVSTRLVGVLAQDLQPGLMEAFREELGKLGDLRDIRIELRDAAGRNERLATLAQELVRLKVEVIVAINTPAVQAAKQATTNVPVVMMRVADPMKSGLVGSLARPGGNVTGLSFMPDALGPKGVELLREIMPRLTHMAALYQGNNPGAVLIVDEVEHKGAVLGLTFARLPVITPGDYTGAFATAARAGSQALFVMDDGAITQHRAEILALAAKHSLPVVSIYRDFAEAGGLIAYGPNLDIVYRRAAHYVHKLLKGEAAGSLPVEQPVNFHLAINMKTAKALGLAIPQSVLIRADEVIE
jgi:ABC-type uncharacterized transport system substrate-binding protein